MNFAPFSGLDSSQFLPTAKVEDLKNDPGDLNITTATTATSSLFQPSNHNIAEFCDNKSVFTSAPSHIVSSNHEERSTQWINLSDRRTYNPVTVAPSISNPTMDVVWQTKVMTKNVSTMTDWESPENLCKNSVTKDNNELAKSSYLSDGDTINGIWDCCSRIHLQRQETAMAEYLSRLQPSSLPISIQQFLNRHNIKLSKDEGCGKKLKINDFKLRNSEVIVTTSVDGNSTLYFCPECRMAYPDRERLETHMEVHRGERRFECNVCGACLKRKEHLDQHKRRHSEDRPFVCEICCKGFKRNEHLRRHFIIHSGNKMYTCDECGKAFSRKDHLNKHAQIHVTKRIKTDGSGGSLLSQNSD